MNPPIVPGCDVLGNALGEWISLVWYHGHMRQQHTEYHRDGSVWAKGELEDGQPDGYWEWFRRNGVKMRSGYFASGEPVGEWTTYDKTGAVYKVTKRPSRG
jgi:antitoxin component YwqK of YwqJK toxin-antitoxin module